MSGRLLAREIRVSACADYLLNVPLKTIAVRHGIGLTTVVSWMRESRDFKLRGHGVKMIPIIERAT